MSAMALHETTSSHPWVPATPRTNSGSPIIAATNTIDKLQVYSPSVGPSSVLQMPHPGPSIYPSQYTVQNPPGHRQYNSSRIDSHRLRQQHRQPRQQRQGAQHTRANQNTRNSVASRRQNQLLHHIENHGLYIPSMSLPKGSMTPLAAIGDYIPSAPSVATTTKTRTKTPAATDSSARTHHAMFATATAAPADNLSTINRRGAPSSQSLSPFEHFIQSYLATQSSSSPDHRHQQFNEFCRATAAYICNGADITRLLPKGFDEKVREAAVTATWTKDDPLESIAVALLEAEENRNDAHFLSKLSLPSWLAVWLSASDKNAKGDWNAVELHLSLLSRDNVERWRAMLPYCAPPAPAQVFPSSMAMDNGGGAGMMGSPGWHDGSQQQEQQQQRQ